MDVTAEFAIQVNDRINRYLEAQATEKQQSRASAYDSFDQCKSSNANGKRCF
jgi:hypothetical protein